MSRFLVTLALASAAGCGVLEAVEVPAPEPIGAATRRLGEATVHEAILPGELVDWLPAVGKSALALLVEEEGEGDEPKKRLMWWELAGAGDLQMVGEALSTDVVGLAGFRPDRVTAAGVLLVAGGSLLEVDAEGRWRSVYESSWDLRATPDSRGGRSSPAQPLLLRSVGRLQALGVDSARDRWQQLWDYQVPMQVDREWSGLRLTSPPVVSLYRSETARTEWIVGPEPHGRRRLRSLWLKAGDEGDVEIVEMWSQLPSAEELQESWYLLLDNEPALVVTTVLAEEHGVFERKKLRLFGLTADRTRSGSGPLLAVTTRTRNWYEMCVGVGDLNGDSRDDLITAQPKGLGGGSLWVEGWLSQPAGGFPSKPLGSEIDVEEGERCTLSADVDGDGRIELVVAEDDDLLVYTLRPTPGAKGVAVETPSWRLGLDSLEGRPRPIEVLAEAATQIFVRGTTEGRRQVVRVIRFH